MSEPSSAPSRGFGYWLSIFANLAVVGGIIFLGIEVSQNAQATRAEIRNAIAESSRVHSRWAAENPEVLDLDRRLQNGEVLTDVEARHLDAFYYAAWRGFENAYYQYTVGTFDEADWGGYERTIELRASMRGHAAYLDAHRFQFSAAFMEYVNSLSH